MKAAYIEQCGPPENIKYGELAEPVIGPFDVLVKMKAVTVDPVDTYIRSGAYAIEKSFPFIIGRDMVGVVQQVGAAVTRFKPKDKVWSNSQGYGGRQGTFATRLCIGEERLYLLPPNANSLEAVAVVHSALTAVTGLFIKAQIQPKESLFINGGSGNVGTAVIQMAKAAGVRVAVTAGSEEKIEWCKACGADFVINYKMDNINEKLSQFAPEGVNVFWDATKTPDVEKALPMVAHRGRIIVMSGLNHSCRLPVGEFYRRNCTLYGFTITELDAQELAAAAKVINENLATGVLKAKIEKVLPLSEAAEAHSMIENDSMFGKLVLVPEEEDGAVDDNDSADSSLEALPEPGPNPLTNG